MENISPATGLPSGISAQLRKLFEMSQDARFVQEHNDRLRRIWDKSKPGHAQVVYSLFDIAVEGFVEPFKPFGSPALHHQFYYQAEKELEYWAATYLGRRVSAAFYVRHYIGNGDEWLQIERKTISLDIPKPAANDFDKGREL